MNPLWSRVLTEVLNGLTQSVEYLNEARQGPSADVCELHALGVAFEKRRPELALETLDLSSHSAGRYPQLLRGESESAKPRRCLESPQGIEGGETREWWCNRQGSLIFSKPNIPEICFAGKP